MKSKIFPILFFSLITLASPSVVKADGDCSQYRYKAGESKIEPVDGGGLKVIMTAQASVLADDTDLIEMAMEEAKMKGRNEIAKFMKNKISGKDEFSTKMVQDVIINPEGKDFNVNKVKEQLKTMGESVDGIVRGIVPLGSCYQPGKFVRVTMGIKPETIAAAGNMDASSNKPYTGSDSSTNASNPNSDSPTNPDGTPVESMQPYNTLPGYSGLNTDF